MSRILFLGPSDFKAMISVLNKALTGWIGAWSPKSQEIFCSYKGRNQCVDENYERISSCLYIADFDLMFRKTAFQDLHFLAPADEVFQYLKRTAVADLGSRIKEGLKIDDSEDSYSVDQKRAVNTPGDQNILYSFTFSEIEFTLVIPVIVHDVLPYRKSTQKGQKLESIKISDIKGPVGISVKLDMGKYSINTISNLSEGDILASKVPLSQEPEILIKDKQFATARLGKKSGQKAIVISKAVK